MERIQCKACGSSSMMPMEVYMDEEEQDALLGDDRESRFFTCPVCGDNWLSVKETDDEGQCTVTFVHQMGMEPVLKRIAMMQTPIIINESTVDEWTYFLDDQQIDEDIWFDKLTERRSVLKSICTN